MGELTGLDPRFHLKVNEQHQIAWHRTSLVNNEVRGSGMDEPAHTTAMRAAAYVSLQATVDDYVGFIPSMGKLLPTLHRIQTMVLVQPSASVAAPCSLDHRARPGVVPKIG